MNWQQILAKMENHINKLTPRRLSLYGKPILLNILILTKTAYLGNVFPIPNQILTQIHKKTFNDLCQNKNLEPIVRKTSCCKKKRED